MHLVQQLLFIGVLAIAVFYFVRNVTRIRRNILLGRDWEMQGTEAMRWKNMFRVALGQSKMVTRPVAGFFHIIVYAGFILINIEVLEIMIDGLFGTHRVFHFLGPLYNVAIGFFEILAFLVLSSCVVFLIRCVSLRLTTYGQTPRQISIPYSSTMLL